MSFSPNKDYIMRIIDQFASALASIIFNRKSKNHVESLIQIQNNVFAPRSIMGVAGDYSCKWECVMDPRQFSPYHNLGWALKDIDYESLGFQASSTLGYLGEYRTWEAPHHLEFHARTIPEKLYYEDKLAQHLALERA